MVEPFSYSRSQVQARRLGGFGEFGRTAHTQAMVRGKMCGHGSIVRGITSTYCRDLDKVVDYYSHLHPRRFELEQWGSRARAHPGPGSATPPWLQWGHYCFWPGRNTRVPRVDCVSMSLARKLQLCSSDLCSEVNKLQVHNHTTLLRDTNFSQPAASQLNLPPNLGRMLHLRKGSQIEMEICLQHWNASATPASVKNRALNLDHYCCVFWKSTSTAKNRVDLT